MQSSEGDGIMKDIIKGIVNSKSKTQSIEDREVNIILFNHENSQEIKVIFSWG